MRKKLLFLLLLFVLFILFVAGRYIMLSRSSQEGRIHIVSSPAASVFINDEASGKTPFEAGLPAGEYLIRLVPDENEASAAATWTGKVRIYDNTKTFVNREIGASDVASSGVTLTIVKNTEDQKSKTGRVEIRTKPDGSLVFLDDEEQGIAPLILAEVPEGDHELSVNSPGFFRRSQKISVKEGFTIIADYQLAVDPSHKRVELRDDPTATDEAELQPTPTGEPQQLIEINQTGTGWLRVRSEPGLGGEEVGRVEPGDQFELLDEDAGWYKIEFEQGTEGWISSQYTRKVEEETTSDESSDDS